MVYITPFIGAAAILSGFVSALPRPADSAVGAEVAVSAPDGTPISDTAELARQTSQTSSATSTSVEAKMTESSDQYGKQQDQYKDGNKYQGGSGYEGGSGYQDDKKYGDQGKYQEPSYGSGKSNWGGSGYDDCVNKCMSTYGAPAAEFKPTATGESSGSSGSGATHTVVVAPTQGVLRYVPFAVNASVGDTIKFMWGANNHTVTKSSSLTPCNKSNDALFISGTQNKDFVFTQVVNDTSPTFFFCGTIGHCQKGMFGIINPPNAMGAPSSVSGMMQSWASNNSDIAAMAAYSTKQTEGNDKASNWGGSIDVKSLPDWSHTYVAENVMYTRNFLAANSEVLKDDGVDLGAVGSNPMMIPEDITVALNNAASSSSSSAAPAASQTASTSAAAASSSSTPNGASSVTSPRIFVGVMVAVVTFFAL